MEAFLSSNGPYAPRSALEHPTVSRVFANIKCIPRDPFTKFSKNAPAKRFVHKKRKLTPQDPQPKRLNTAPQQRQRPRQQKHDKAGKSGTQASTQSLSSKDRDDPQVPGAKLFLFRDRPEIMEAAKLITETNYRMGRQLNRLCEKRKILDKSYNKLQESARHFAEVEGKALLADKSDRDRFIERLRNELETMRYKAYLGTHQTKQYVRLLRRSKQQTRGVARSVVEKQEELSRWTEPVGGHVARARNQVEVENTAWSVETKKLEKHRNEHFETIRLSASKLSELRQNTTDQKLAISLEEKAVTRREAIRKTALLEMAHHENKKLVSRALSVSSKQRMTKRTYLKLLTTLAKFQRLMQRLETSTGVVGIDGVVKRWFEREEREKSLHADQVEYEVYIKKCTVELEKMQQQLDTYQTFGTDTAFTKRASRDFEKLLASYEIRFTKSKVKLQKSGSMFRTERLNLGLVAECLRSLCVRFKLNAQAKALSKQLGSMLGYTNLSENKLLTKRLTQSISALDRTICNMGRSILTGVHADVSGSVLKDPHSSQTNTPKQNANSTTLPTTSNAAATLESNGPSTPPKVSPSASIPPSTVLAPTSPTHSTSTPSATSATSATSTTSTTSSTDTSEETERDGELIYGLKKKSISTMNKLKKVR